MLPSQSDWSAVLHCAPQDCLNVSSIDERVLAKGTLSLSVPNKEVKSLRASEANGLLLFWPNDGGKVDAHGGEAIVVTSTLASLGQQTGTRDGGKWCSPLRDGSQKLLERDRKEVSQKRTSW